MPEYERLLNVCPCQQWRVILALLRIGGLRPGEVKALRWENVMFDKRQLCVISPKTKRYKGKEQRVLPLFPKLESELKAWRQESDEGEFVIDLQKRNKNFNFCEKLNKIAMQGGIMTTKIPKFCDNCRMSRSNEILAMPRGEVKEPAWIGHSRKVAQDHYYRISENDFLDALQPSTMSINFPC